MRIELENLEGGKGSFVRTYQPDELNPVDERVSLTVPASVKGTVKRAGNDVCVNGHVDARVQVECDRCLKPVELPVSADFDLEYITGAEYESSSAAALSEEELAVSVFDGDAIDVDEIVKEQILLAVPARTLCREDCKGICPECGMDLNTGQCNCAADEVDPRWAALKSLKNTDTE
ncbi:MAG TPA: DUF177 domain-containing protein [Pyrinomonadaceae bacterium]|nr:DUF177 domain-containing protein [Pyrinomonadaceae bacterium]